MNEKIKQLAQNAGFAYEPVKDQLWVSGPNEIMITPGLEKFAELIIRECACPSCGSHHGRDINAAINIKNQGQLDCYEQLLDQFWSDGTADQGSMIPARLEKYASKTERSKTPVLVGIGTDEDTRSLVVY